MDKMSKRLSTLMDKLHRQMSITGLPKHWWEKEVVQYAFTHPHVRSRLERLMGTNVVRITDRRFMQHLQKRIQEDHEANLQKRIQQREAEEVDREKRLLLDGKIPVELAPKELADHPVFKITQITTKVIAVRRSKLKIPLSVMTASFYVHIGGDDEMETVGAGEAAAVSGVEEVVTRRESGLYDDYDSLDDQDEFDEEGRDEKEMDETAEAEDDVSRGYMFTQEEYDRLKYESPLVKQLRTIETVEEMYRLADEIVGPLRTLRHH